VPILTVYFRVSFCAFDGEGNTLAAESELQNSEYEDKYNHVKIQNLKKNIKLTLQKIEHNECNNQHALLQRLLSIFKSRFTNGFTNEQKWLENISLKLHVNITRHFARCTHYQFPDCKVLLHGI